jgi:hypothetical protein
VAHTRSALVGWTQVGSIAQAHCRGRRRLKKAHRPVDEDCPLRRRMGSEHRRRRLHARSTQGRAVAVTQWAIWMQWRKGAVAVRGCTAWPEDRCA